MFSISEHPQYVSFDLLSSGKLCQGIFKWVYTVRNSKMTWVCFWRDSLQWARASSYVRFLDHTQRRTTVGRTPLDEWSACRTVYLTTHNTHNRQTSMPPGGIRTYNLNRREAADLNLRPRGYWDRQKDNNKGYYYYYYYYIWLYLPHN